MLYRPELLQRDGPCGSRTRVSGLQGRHLPDWTKSPKWTMDPPGFEAGSRRCGRRRLPLTYGPISLARAENRTPTTCTSSRRSAIEPLSRILAAPRNRTGSSGFSNRRADHLRQSGNSRDVRESNPSRPVDSRPASPDASRPSATQGERPGSNRHLPVHSRQCRAATPRPPWFQSTHEESDLDHAPIERGSCPWTMRGFRRERIRTADPLAPDQVLCQAELHAVAIQRKTIIRPATSSRRGLI